MLGTSAVDRPRLTVVRAARLFDGVSDDLLVDPVVVLDGGRIVAVETSRRSLQGAHVVDLPGSTLLPGLVDAHVHLAFDASSEPVAALAARDDEAAVAAMRAAARTALSGGVTTVRDLGDRGYLALGLRHARDLPTILAAGPPLTTPAGHCHYLGGVVEDGPDAVRAAVREHAERGVDVVKIMASGGTLTPGTRQELSQFSPQSLRAGVAEAHRLGLPVAAHAHGRQAIADAVRAGVDSIEHASFWSADGVDEPGELLDEIVARKIVVGATVGVKPVPGIQPPPAVLARLPAIAAVMMRLYQGGVRFMAGTDAGIGPGKPHDAARYVPQTLTAIGLGTTEALRLVTSAPADACGLAGRKGRLAPGYDADLLAVDGDPTTDITAMHRITAVYAHGNRIR